MDLILRNELLVDPLGRGYAAMSDTAASNDINTNMRSVRAFVTVGQLLQYLIGQIDGAGVDQRSSLDMIREFAEAGTVRGVVPGSMTAGEARQSGCNMIWYMLKYGQPDNQFLVDDGALRVELVCTWRMMPISRLSLWPLGQMAVMGPVYLLLLSCWLYRPWRPLRSHVGRRLVLE